MSAQNVIDEIVRGAEQVIRRAMLTIAGQLRNRILELDTKNGKFVRDQARITLSLADDIRLLAKEVAPGVVQEVVSDLTDLLQETLNDHPELGKYKPEIGNQLLRVFRSGASEIARVIVDTASDEVTSAIEGVVLAGAPIEDVVGPVAKALNTTRLRATIAVERAVREFHETSLKEMGKNSGLDMVYLYVGPDTGNIRPYCENRVDKILSQEQADALNPRERFNCRHSLAPVLAGTVDNEEFVG